MSTEPVNPPESSEPANAAPTAAAGQPNEFLTFRLGNEEFGIEIVKVQEIRGWEQPATIANAPEFIKGAIDLRGNIVPIIDMRIIFRPGNVEYDESTVVIILNVANRVVGMAVDGVSGVTTLSGEQVGPPRELGGALDTQHIVGIATVQQRMLILLDIERLMCSRDMALMDGNPSL